MNSPTDTIVAAEAALSARLTIARAVNAKLRDVGIPQRKAADLTGIPMTTFGYCIRGERAFDIDQLARVAHVLDVRLADLITYAENTGSAVA